MKPEHIFILVMAVVTAILAIWSAQVISDDVQKEQQSIYDKGYSDGYDAGRESISEEKGLVETFTTPYDPKYYTDVGVLKVEQWENWSKVSYYVK